MEDPKVREADMPASCDGCGLVPSRCICTAALEKLHGGALMESVLKRLEREQEELLERIRKDVEKILDREDRQDLLVELLFQATRRKP